MGSLVAMQQHLCLNLAQLPDKEKTPPLDAPGTATGLFGVAVGAIREKFDTAHEDSAAWT